MPEIAQEWMAELACNPVSATLTQGSNDHSIWAASGRAAASLTGTLDSESWVCREL